MSSRPRRLLVRVLGPLAVTGPADAAGALRHAPLRAVLATLALTPNDPVPLERLATVAWGARPVTGLDDALGTLVSRLRTLLAPVADVRWSGGGYTLCVEPGRIDAVRFERLVEAATRATPRQAARLLGRALELWRGPVAYPDLRPGGLDHPEAVRLAELRHRAIDRLARCELALGRAGAAADRLLEVIRVRPARESSAVLAVHALHHAGRAGEVPGLYRFVCDRLAAEIGADPSVELREAYRAVTGCSPGPCGHAWPVRPPRRPPPTSFVDRTSEVARLRALSATQRLVTVTGPGGVGKTRLLLAALSTLDTTPAYAELALLPGDAVPAAVAVALGIEATGKPDDVAAAVADYLADRRRLLVLDGCEDVLEAVRALLKRLFTRCPGVTVLATSRVPLGLGGEYRLPLAPLSAEPAGDPLDSPAGVLFLDRAGRAVPPDEAERVRSLLASVVCLPLTVELLAARDLAELPEPPRDVLDLAYGRLSSDDRRLLEALSVFHADADGTAVEEVADAGPGTSGGLARLRAAALVTMVDGRYRMPGFVRRFAAHRLAESPRERKVRDRHTRWVQELVAEPADETTVAERLRRHAADITAAGLPCAPPSPHLSAVDCFLPGSRPGDRHTRALDHHFAGEDGLAAIACRELLATPGLSPARQADAHSLLALSAPGHDGALHAVARARALAEAAGSLAARAFAGYAEGRVRAATDPAGAIAVLTRARADARGAGAARVDAAAGTTQAEALLRLGRVPEAGKVLLAVFDHVARLRVRPQPPLDVAARALAAFGDPAADLSVAAATAALHRHVGTLAC